MEPARHGGVVGRWEAAGQGRGISFLRTAGVRGVQPLVADLVLVPQSHWAVGLAQSGPGGLTADRQ